MHIIICVCVCMHVYVCICKSVLYKYAVHVSNEVCIVIIILYMCAHCIVLPLT